MKYVEEKSLEERLETWVLGGFLFLCSAVALFFSISIILSSMPELRIIWLLGLFMINEFHHACRIILLERSSFWKEGFWTGFLLAGAGLEFFLIASGYLHGMALMVGLLFLVMSPIMVIQINIPVMKGDAA